MLVGQLPRGSAVAPSRNSVIPTVGVASASPFDISSRHASHPSLAATSPVGTTGVSMTRLPSNGATLVDAGAPMVNTGSMRVVSGATIGLPPDGAVDAETLAELEELQKRASAQEARIAELSKELATARESEGKLRTEADSARAEAARLVEELRKERAGREQAQANATSASANMQPGAQAPQRNPSSPAVCGVSAKRRSLSTAAQGHSRATPARTAPQDGSSPASASVRSRDAGKTSASNLTGGRRSPSPPVRQQPVGQQSQPQQQQQQSQQQQAPAAPSKSSEEKRPSLLVKDKEKEKDEIDARLQDFLERSDGNLSFKRLNKGFYMVRRAGENKDRNVEVSIVNGKLMVRLESSSTETGWNNGKLGPVEKFAAFLSAMP